VIDLRNRIEQTCELASKELQKSSSRYKVNYDKKSKDKKLDIGDKILILLPADGNKLLMQWKGPFVVVGKVGICDYKVSVNGRVKTYHANLLKKYF